MNNYLIGMIYFMKKVYITGISGMLGSNIGYLFKNKYSVCGVDKIILKRWIFC